MIWCTDAGVYSWTGDSQTAGVSEVHSLECLELFVVMSVFIIKLSVSYIVKHELIMCLSKRAHNYVVLLLLSL